MWLIFCRNRFDDNDTRNAANIKRGLKKGKGRATEWRIAMVVGNTKYMHYAYLVILWSGENVTNVQRKKKRKTDTKHEHCEHTDIALLNLKQRRHWFLLHNHRCFRLFIVCRWIYCVILCLLQSFIPCIWYQIQNKISCAHTVCTYTNEAKNGYR